MNILLIGNGFDIAHGLPTSYQDFLEFANAFLSYKNDKEYSSVYSDYFTSIIDESLKDELMASLKDNLWINYFFNIRAKLIEKGQVGWIDFEKEISYVVRGLDEAECILSDQFEKGIDEGRLLFENWRIIGPVLYGEDYHPDDFKAKSFGTSFISISKTRLLDDLDCLIRGLEIYLSGYVDYYFDSDNRIELPHCDFSKLSISALVCFNYTNTYSKLYKQEDKVLMSSYVHGSAQLSHFEGSRTNIVLGIDEYLRGENIDQDNRYYEFKKFYQRIYKNTDTNYQDIIDQIRAIKTGKFKGYSPHHNLYIYGHSLDMTDKDILSELILSPNVYTFIYYHNLDAKRLQIGNLIKIIGEEELITRTKGKNRTITFIPNTADVGFDEDYPFDWDYYIGIESLLNK